MNCAHNLGAEDRFCPACGQPQITLHRSLRQLLLEWIESTFNLNNKLFVTLWTLMRWPGQLAQDYSSGKQARYLSPVRLYLFLSLLYVGNAITKESGEGLNLYGGPEHARYVLALDSLDRRLDNTLDSLKMALPACAGALDSLKKVQKQSLQAHLTEADSLLNDTLQFSLFTNKPIAIPVQEILLLSEEDLLKKYQVQGWLERLVFMKILRLLQHPREFLMDFIQSKSWWNTLLLIPILGLILYVLFRKKRRFYAEHLLLSFDIHNFSLVFGIPLIFLKDNPATYFVLFLGIASIIYLFFAIQRFYSASGLRLVLKIVFILAAFIPSFLVSLILTLIISLILF
ncbi:MAG: DUF3667 domain-containing protein [Flavobacteriales bacterium]|nr:DUF3667 domain-containing protein [Flavobacteriales bacterium]